MGQQSDLWEHKEIEGLTTGESTLKDKEWPGVREEVGKCDVMSDIENFQEGSCLSNSATLSTVTHIQTIDAACSLDMAVSSKGKYKTKWRQCYSAL